MNKKKRGPKRLAIVFLIVGLLLLVCIIQAVVIVVKNGSEYKHKALAQAAGSSTVLLARPGNIVDANGMYLTSTRKVYRLILDPNNLYENEKNYAGTVNETVRILASSFSLDAEELLRTFSENSSSQYIRFSSCPILEEEDYKRYQKNVKAFNEAKQEHNEALAEKKITGQKITARIAGVWFEEEYRRSYPFGAALSKIIGYTTVDTTEGILGLEKQYKSELSGTDGREYTYVDDQGNVTKEITKPLNGCTVYTSLDINVSRILSEEIRNFQENMEGGERVNVLVMNPGNGEIVAMESDTEFDLNNPTDLSALFTEEKLQHPEEQFLLKEAYLTRPEALESMSYEDRLTALLQCVQSNFAVSQTFEPGSTAKTLTIASGIEEGSVTRNDTWYCDGAIQVENYKIHCHSDTLCGDLTAIEALGRSCNVCLVQIAQQIGKSGFIKYQERFNLGQKTGIDLPGEANTKNLLYYENNMNAVELATCSFGQGFNVTMLQMAAAYASILNGGTYYQPHVVTKITDENGNTVREITPTVVRRTVSRETCEFMKEALQYVVLKGTASGYLYHEGYELGGKTGAAEKLPRGTGKYIVSFIGGAPMSDPEFLLYVVVDEPHTEDQSQSLPAQRLASNIFKRLYEYYSVFPEGGEDAYAYNWDDLKDSSKETEGAKGEPNVEDPDDTIQWLEDEENIVAEPDWFHLPEDEELHIYTEPIQ